jgi:hypothetical protein
MKHHLIFIICTLILSGTVNAQNSLTKKKLEMVFKETLKKSRNAVETATNNWRYDNSKGDYFENDTVTLNTARTYKMNYCNGTNWSFYKTEKFLLENVQYCNEPPTKLISKKEDSLKLKIKELGNKIFLELYNINGFFEKFEVLSLKSNEPLSSEGDYQFDYTMILLRINK